MSKRNYIVNPELGLERLGDADYKKTRAVADLFEPVAKLPDIYCGNIAIGLAFTLKTKKFSYLKNQLEAYDKPETYAPLYRVMPSALWLYRLLCLYQCTVHSEGPNGYKTVWSIGLRHKKTNEVIVFREWKGGFSLGHAGDSAPKGELKTDLLKLLTLLASDACPHPYDGVVAGSVA